MQKAKTQIAVRTLGAVAIVFWSVPGQATKDFGFVTDPAVLTASLALPVIDVIEPLVMQEESIRQRVHRSPEDRTVEPLSIDLPHNEEKLANLAAKLAKPAQVDALAARLRRMVVKDDFGNREIKKQTLEITDTLLKFINVEALREKFTKLHHNVTIQSAALTGDRGQRDELVNQLRFFLPAKERRRIATRLANGDPVHIDSDLLPEFPKRMVKKFTIFRGPNCFHAALAFQNASLPRSDLVNVAREEGYHKAMINYDELWRALNQHFYEVNPAQSTLKFGDILVFFDVENASATTNFRWIKHTSTYLFGAYTFSKGSKSPNTPYSVKTIAEEWDTWSHNSKNLGLRVFRRPAKNVITRANSNISDWLY